MLPKLRTICRLVLPCSNDADVFVAALLPFPYGVGASFDVHTPQRGELDDGALGEYEHDDVCALYGASHAHDVLRDDYASCVHRTSTCFAFHIRNTMCEWSRRALRRIHHAK